MTTTDLVAFALPLAAVVIAFAQGETAPTPIKVPGAVIDGSAEGWRSLGEADFVNVNCKPETFTWDKGLIRCTGNPVGVMRTKKQFTNFELVVMWRHLRSAGNSGIFIWTIPASIEQLKKGGQLPHGIEAQILDHGYAEQYEKRRKRKPNWFTTHGDVFPVGAAKMQPFPPTAPNQKRSFPSENRSKGVGQWNHYYLRCINGEVRLWVNGREVSGGTGCTPSTGYLCLESEGSPVEFRGLRLRELP